MKLFIAIVCAVFALVVFLLVVAADDQLAAPAFGPHPGYTLAVICSIDSQPGTWLFGAAYDGEAHVAPQKDDCGKWEFTAHILEQNLSPGQEVSVLMAPDENERVYAVTLPYISPYRK